MCLAQNLSHERHCYSEARFGKRQRRAPVTPGIISLNSVSQGSMSVFDSNSETSFLVDSGADISVLPLSFLSSTSSKAPKSRPGQRLRAANGSCIDTFGTKTIGLRLPGFQTRHSFRVARVAQPILGADFFRRHGITIDAVSYTHLTLPTILLV